MMSASISVLTAAVILIYINFCSSQCIPRESKALLMFKASLIVDSDTLASWDAEEDCCSWFGIVCDDYTGHVRELHLQSTNNDDGISIYLQGNVNESLLELKHLEYLDLSNNNFDQMSIPGFFGFMSTLRFLNLSNSRFGGKIPGSIGNLTSLDTLDLSENDFVGETPSSVGNLSNLQYLSIGSSSIDKLDWVSRLSSLEFLDFSTVNLNIASDSVEGLGKLPYLQQLRLSGCQLTQIPPFSNFSLSSLSVLDLSENLFNFSIPNNLFSRLTKLKLLDLSGNYFVGQIPSSIGNLTSLNTLDFSRNNFVGKIPTSFKSLCNLRLLSLTSTQLNQKFNELIEILSFCVSNKLESLDLSNSQFSGYLSNLLIKFKSLGSLDVSTNLITGPLPIGIGEMSSLTLLRLYTNNLNGSLPSSLGRLENLVEFDVSNNILEGEISEIHFENLFNLLYFDASENHLIWKGNPDWVPPFQLVELLVFGSCKFGPRFPTWVRHLKHLRTLQFSDSNINSLLPPWLFNFSSTLQALDLSNNQMYGTIPNFSSGLIYIDLSSNHFKGPVPYIDCPPDWLDLSNNFLSGSMHNFLCNTNLSRWSLPAVLIFKDNHLNGEIPATCLINFWLIRFVSVLDLSNNNFSGKIPKSMGSAMNLQMLGLRNNSFTGEIPSTLQNCTGLVALDLGENELNGEIPSWIGKHLTELKIINFRGNKLHGHMPKELCNLPKLQVLDLANNKLNGTIPTCVGNLTGMSTIVPLDDAGRIEIYPSYYSYSWSSEIVRKGQLVNYGTTLGFVQILDLSNNSFVGEIPQAITNLSELQSLNLSYNFLTRRIPQDIGAMKKLESLDLCQNRLFGEIPQSMSSMTFLSYLNLSNNNLSGQIPTSTQLQSMDPSSFTGNKLCGPPLTKDCNNKEETPASNAERRKDHGSEMGAVDWFYFSVSLAPGFVVGFWCVVGPLAFNIRWRRAYYNFLDRLWDKVWVWYHVNIVRFVRNYGS